MKTLAFLLLTLVSANAQFLTPSNPPPRVQLAYSPSTGGTGRITNYNVYWGVGSGHYTAITSAGGNGTNVTITLPVRGQVYFFAVTAIDSNSLESGFSNEVTYTTPAPPNPPVQQPIVVLTVQWSSTPTGTFADAGMNWSIDPVQSQQYYKLKMNHGIILSAATPPKPPTLK